MTDEQTIGEILVDIPNLKSVLQTLIDEYAIENCVPGIELLHFQQWVERRYPAGEEPKP